MRELDILKFPNPSLKKPSVEVDKIDDSIRQFAKDLLTTMYAQKGIGLSAPQVNRHIRIIAVDTRAMGLTSLEKEIKFPLVLVNPVVLKKRGKTSFQEGCLSVPNYFGWVDRAEEIYLEALNLEGNKVQFWVDGITSICIQHEIDHLDGKLFLDRLSNE